MHRVKQCPCLRAQLHWTLVWCFRALRTASLADSHCQGSCTGNRAAGLGGDQDNTESDCPFCGTFHFKTATAAVLVFPPLSKLTTKTVILTKTDKKKKKKKRSSSFRLNSLARISIHFGVSCVLVSSRIELVFFLVTGTVLCFGFSMRIILITHCCLDCR